VDEHTSLRVIAEELGVRPNTLRLYSSKYDDFPRPVTVDQRGHGTAWSFSEVKAWIERPRVTLAEAAKKLGLTHNTMRNYSRRYSGFPAPKRVNVNGSGVEWDLGEIIAWNEGRPGKGGAQHHRDPKARADKAAATLRARNGTTHGPRTSTQPKRRRKMTTEPIKKATENLCLGGCGKPVLPGQRVYGVKNKPGRYVHEECGLRMKAAKEQAS
jgi:predicted DNA-binding transcriptional regulator AlpA